MATHATNGKEQLKSPKRLEKSLGAGAIPTASGDARSPTRKRTNTGRSKFRNISMLRIVQDEKRTPPDDTPTATVGLRVLNDLEAHLHMNSSRFFTCEEIRNKIMACAESRTGARRDAPRDDTMDVHTFEKPRGKNVWLNIELPRVPSRSGDGGSDSNATSHETRKVYGTRKTKSILVSSRVEMTARVKAVAMASSRVDQSLREQ